MANYKLTNKAVEDLNKIWNYTFEVWSEYQADKYYDNLIEDFKSIAENPYLGRNYQGIKSELFGVKSNSHIIFYRIEENYVEITRILHERMNLRKRILE